MFGRKDSVHRPLLEAISETANVLELRQKFLHTTPVWVVAVVYRIALPDFRILLFCLKST